MRKVFNSEIRPGIDSGVFLEMVISAAPPAPKYGEPQGTLSQMVEYWAPAHDGATMEQVALIHRFLRPDGTLGASGKPDPKRVLYDGTLYLLAKKKG